MKILCGTDFSTASASALRVALNLARRFGDTLVVAHVFDATSLAVSELGSLEQSFREAAGKTLSLRMDGLRAEGIPCESVVLEGHADVKLVEHARAIAARVIVIGTHGRRAPVRWLLGSTAERVLDATDRPVLVVPQGAADLGEWALGRRPLHAVVGLDAGPAGDAAIEGVRMLRHAGTCDATFVHLYLPPAAHQRFGIEPSQDLLTPDAQISALLERELQPRLAGLAGRGRTTLQIRPTWEPFGRTLGALSAEADLFVVGASQRTRWERGFQGSVAHAALREASAPMLCMPAAAFPQPEILPAPRLQHVLVPVDFSSLSSAAIRYGCALARGGLVHLCHVYEPPLAARIGEGQAGARMTPEQRHELLGRIEKLAVLATPEVTTRTMVVEGEPAVAIVQAAERLGVDAICLASHGRTGIRRAVLGSVASRVLESTTRPVLIVWGQA